MFIEESVGPNRRTTLEDGGQRYGKRNRSTKTVRAELPRLLALTCTCVHGGHEEDNVCRRRDVEQLEEEEPCVYEALECRRP